MKELEMPRPLRREIARRRDGVGDGEETLVLDGRTHIGPAQCVEEKLAVVLRDSPLPLSHARLLGLGRRSLG